MLFSAPEFLFAFLPVTLAGFFIIGVLGRPSWAALWLIAASLFFYGWWRPEFVFLILGSVLFNFVVGRALSRTQSLALLAFGIAANLAALGWFKYSGFLAELVNDVAGLGLPIPQVLLPVGISFYTFQQIGYLVDARSDDAREDSFLHYLLFVSFFPQLLAGPIVHHRETMSQFHRPETYKPQSTNLLLGITAFSIGLFKKVFIGDTLAPQAEVAFGPAADGIVPVSGNAWFGVLAYTLQLYFDFSGYSDMAVGLGLMFGIRLPINFASPFKAASIIEFWSRWHMTLTRFLTAYIYNPIVTSIARRRVAAGKKLLRQKNPEMVPFAVQLAMPTLITMFLAGIWHGAGWQFLAFGLFHGVLLVMNHGWRTLRHAFGLRKSYGPLGHAAGVLVTFLSVAVGLVFFRADSFEHALLILKAMAGFGGEYVGVRDIGGPDLHSMGLLERLFWNFSTAPGLLMIAGFVIVWALPNVSQFVEHLATKIERRTGDVRDAIRLPFFRQNLSTVLPLQNRFLQGSCIGALLAFALLRALSVTPKEFLYFTF